MACGLALALAGCATASGPPAPAGALAQADRPRAADPFEGFNRRMFALGQAFDRHVVRPIVAGLQGHTPGGLRRAAHNFLQNADEPVVFVNDLLQARFRPAARTAARFVGNTTVGLAGLFDPAAKAGLAHHDNDFGLTLGRYGFAAGPYLYLPVLGPTTLRDAFGLGVDYVVDPLSWLRFADAKTLGGTRAVLDLVDQRLDADADLRSLDATAADPYATLRSVYGQAREAELKGEEAELEALPELTPAEAAPEPAPPSQAAAPPAPPPSEPEPPGPQP